MTKIEKILELCRIVKGVRLTQPEFNVVDILTEEAIDEVFAVLPKLLDLAKATNSTYHGTPDMKDCAICMAIQEFEK